MNAPTSTLEPEVEVTSGELVLLNEQTTLQVLTDEKRFDDLLAKIKAEVSTHVPDLTTDKGRKAIASLAFKVTKTKTALDDAEAAAKAKREADAKHRSTVMGAAKEALMTHAGITEEAAKAAVLAIAAGEVPHVTITF